MAAGLAAIVAAGAAPSARIDAATPPGGAASTGRGIVPAAGRSVLRQLPQRPARRPASCARRASTCRTSHATPQILEKVVAQAAQRQMPPEGRPRPDKATLDAFIAALETALDRACGGRAQSRARRVAPSEPRRIRQRHPRPARPGSRTAPSLLPSDMAGFGFDNNADVLSITPALMARYIAAATKISRARGRQPRQSVRSRRSTRSASRAASLRA